MSDAPPIGYLVWWDLTKASLERKKLAGLWDRLSLPAKAAKYTKKRDAFRRSVQFFRVYLGRAQFKGYVLDRVQKIHANRYRLCILRRIPGPRRTKIKQVLSIFYSYGELECKKPKHELFLKFREFYNHTKNILPYPDITMILTSMLVSSGALLMHPKGRIYYVPYDAKDVLEKIKLFLESADGEKHFWAVPQQASADIHSAIEASLHRYLVAVYRHFDYYDSKNYKGKAIIDCHFNFMSRGRDILEYYVRKYGIDLTEKLKKYDERLSKFKAHMG